MACACGKNKASQRQIEHDRGDTKVPHSILPGESCIFCAEKHIAMAFATICNTSVNKAYGRHLLMGELELARRHTVIAYTDIAASIKTCIDLAYLRKPDEDILSALKLLTEDVAVITAAQKDGLDTSGTTDRYVEPPPTGGPSVRVGELFVCAAWRLAEECGYEDINRPMIIGNIAAAQWHLYKTHRGIAEKLRDIRHIIQRAETPDPVTDWNAVLISIDRVTQTYNGE